MKRKTTNLDKLHADASISMEGMVKRTLSLFGTGIHTPLSSRTSRCKLVRYSNLVRESLVRDTNVSHCEPRVNEILLNSWEFFIWGLIPCGFYCNLFESHVRGTMIKGEIFRSHYVFGDFLLLAFRKQVDGEPVSFCAGIVRSINTFFKSNPPEYDYRVGRIDCVRLNKCPTQNQELLTKYKSAKIGLKTEKS